MDGCSSPSPRERQQALYAGEPKRSFACIFKGKKDAITGYCGNLAVKLLECRRQVQDCGSENVKDHEINVDSVGLVRVHLRNGPGGTCKQAPEFQQ
jgi:hypothetical protein